MTTAAARASGDAALWRRLPASMRRPACCSTGTQTADWSVAEDLTAAVFLQAWRRRGQVVFDGDSAHPSRHGHGHSPAGLRWQVPATGLHEVVVRTSAGAVTVQAALAASSVVVSATRHFSGKAPAISLAT